MAIVQFRGKTGPYLEAASGAASLDLFRMAREGLTAALRQAIQHATRTGRPVKAEHVRVKSNGGIREVGLEVIPIGPAEGAGGRHHVVLFFEERPRPTGPAPQTPARQRAPRPTTARERRVAQLTQELADARQHLHATSEEHEAAMEELRAATEEAQSSNEELQSTNEELETAKEELQATNEELTTVNDELSSRNAELRRFSDDLGNILTSTHVPIIMVGSDLRVRRMTPVTERALSVAPGDVGRPIGDLRLSVEVPDLEALLREVMETLTIQEREIAARDGRWYAVRIRPYRTADNKIDGAVVSFVDIDAIKRGLEQVKQARDQAQAVIETVRQPLLVLTPDLRVVTANRPFYETFAVAAPETVHQSIFDLGNHQWDIPRLRTLLGEILPRDSVIEDFEVEHEFQTIGRRTMLLNARRLLSGTGQPAMILLAIEDVTDRRRLEAESAAFVQHEQTLRAGAETATMAKDRFLAVLSHELRTPLTAMFGWARLLKTQKLDPAAAARAIEVIERNTALQARLIEDLLDVSRIVTGTLHLDARPVMLAPVVGAALAAMQPAADAKGVLLTSALDEGAGPVRGDPARLQQIVANLVSNAIKFTPSGGRVDVRLARLGSDVELTVRDTGQGLTAAQLARLFVRFDLAPHRSTQSQGGLGLGLAIARHLVDLQSGNIQAESPGPGQGATFTVTLPLTDERPAGEAGEIAIQERAPAPSLEGVRVLVVDDKADARELVETILARGGAEVTAVASARAALEALEQARFDVLVSDVAMPEEDGYDLIRNVRALDAMRGGRIPALALTAHARAEDRTAALAAGYQQHAAKPIEPDDLATAVAALAGRT
jgi:two-component system CheB/CheR fusion protein